MIPTRIVKIQKIMSISRVFEKIASQNFIIEARKGIIEKRKTLLLFENALNNECLIEPSTPFLPKTITGYKK